MLVRTNDLKLELCERRFSVWRARLRAWGELATMGSSSCAENFGARILPTVSLSVNSLRAYSVRLRYAAM